MYFCKILLYNQIKVSGKMYFKRRLKLMIKDILNLFKAYYDKNGDKAILDQKKLMSGLYIKVNKDFSIKKMYINNKNVVFTLDNQNNETEIGAIEIKNEEGKIEKNVLVNTNYLYNWFKDRVYYSSILDTNKSIDSGAMKIHSNNYLSFFTKKDYFTLINNGEKTIDFDTKDTEKWNEQTFSGKNKYKHVDFATIVNKHYDILCLKKNAIYSNNLKNPIYLQEMSNNDILSTNINVNIEQIDMHRNYILTNFISFVQLASTLNLKGYIYVLFDANIDEYINEYKKYIIPNLYNKDLYNTIVNNKLYGLSGFNINDNEKKPFSKNLTTPFFVCNKITLADAYYLNKFENWIKVLPTSRVFIDENTFQIIEYKNLVKNNNYFYLKMNCIDGSILDFQYISNFNHNINFLVNNITNIPDVDRLQLNYLYDLEQEINKVFFNYKMYYEDLKVSDSLNAGLISVIQQYGEPIYNYFRKKIKINFSVIIDKVTLLALKQQLFIASPYKCSTAFNLHIALLDYFNKSFIANDIMDMEELDIANLPDDINTFSYICGQVIKFINNKNQKPDFAIINKFINCKSINNMQNNINILFKKEAHNLGYSHKSLNTILEYISSYNCKRSINIDFLLAGYLNYNNILYK